MKFILYCIGRLYGRVISLRNLCYRLGLLQIYKFKTPIVSVGNIAMGGSGKTPMVVFLSRLLTKHKIKHAIVSRGYKKTLAGTVVVQGYTEQHVYNPVLAGDEPVMLAKKLLGVPILVDNKKQKAIAEAITTFNPQIILLDDAFQSIYIQKNKNYVLIDCSISESKYKLLPRGILREPLKELGRADLVVFVNKSVVNNVLSSIEKRIKRLLDEYNVPSIHAKFHSSLYKHNYHNKNIVACFPEKQINLPVMAVSGIGNSGSFVDLVNNYFNNVVQVYNFSDHYNYQNNQKKLETIIQKNSSCAGIVTTLKDYVKIIGLPIIQSLQSQEYIIYILDIDIIIKETNYDIEKELLGLCLRKG